MSHTAQLIKEGDFSQIDTANLIEEIEDIGRSEKQAIESNLVVVLLHLLKYKYQPEKALRPHGEVSSPCGRSKKERIVAKLVLENIDGD